MSQQSIQRITPRWRRLLAAGWIRTGATFVAGSLFGMVGLFVTTANQGTPPAIWHTFAPTRELTAEDLGPGGSVRDLDAYLAAEAALFAEVHDELARHTPELPAHSRFLPTSRTHPSRFPRDWNRTFVLEPAATPRGDALLLHGLSDSPYSLRTIGEMLAAEGWRVVGLRLPGHGTVPGALARVSREDWRAAVRLGVTALRAPSGPAPTSPATASSNPPGPALSGAERPLVIVGYSNGGALALDYTLSALAARRHGASARAQDPLPDRLVFLSPAFAVSSAAAVASWQANVGRLPGLGRLAWSPLEPELDPFKYSSFPIAAASEIHGLTSEIASALEELAASGDQLPPLLTLQSVVDATIPPVPSLTRLYNRLGRGAATSELVLFDANRTALIETLLSSDADDLLDLAEPGQTFPFAVTLITNESRESSAVVAYRRAAGSLDTSREPLGLSWPTGVYSLSHVALPFPPDDPVYGAAGSPAGPPFPFGSLELKGERGAFAVSATLLARLRYNPFYAVVRREIRTFLGLATASADGAAPAAQPAAMAAGPASSPTAR